MAGHDPARERVVAGEVQSAVIPPKVNSRCPEGRFLVSLDTLRPPTPGLVLSRRLDSLSKHTIPATFDLPKTHPEYYAYLTNDHDLVALPSGDVFYVTGAGSKAPLDEKLNPWIPYAQRPLTDGTILKPGARSVVLIHWEGKLAQEWCVGLLVSSNGIPSNCMV